MVAKRHTKRAVIYTRQSLDRNGTGLAVARQRKACEKLCTERGFTVVETLTDNDLSASTGKHRPGYQRVLDLVDAALVDVVVVWHIDRFVRRLADLEDVITRCEKTGVRLATVSGDLDLSTDQGRLVGRILASVARGEVERKGARQRAALDQAAAMGKPIRFAHRSFGYLADFVTPHPVEGLAVREACRAIAAGASLTSIARKWNADALPTPQGGQKWQHQTVRSVLTNPRIAGLRRRDGELHTGSWTPLVDRETWESVVRTVTDPARTPPRGVRTLLSGIAKCVCGQYVSGGRRYDGEPTYRCRDLPGGGGGHVGRVAAPVDRYIIDRVLVALSADDARDLLYDRTRPDVDDLRAQMVAVNTRLDRLAEDNIEGTVTDAQLKAGTKRAKAILVELESGLADADRLAVLGPLVDSDDVEAAWKALDLSRQRAVIDLLMEEITLLKPGMGKRTFDPRTVPFEWRKM